MRQAFRFLCFAVLVTFPLHAVHARTRQAPSERVKTIAPPTGATDNPASASPGVGFSAAAAAETTLLYSATFGNASNCSPQGWTSVDLTTQPGDYWHVDDYAGLPFGAVEGTKSLWCGARPQGGEIFCTYQALPGYGNGWYQSWCTKDCLSITGGPTPQLDVSFALRYDSEASYDATSLQYTTDCDGNVGWTEIDGGNPTWTGVDQITVDQAYIVYNGTTVKVRLHFASDTAWSDQDNFYDSDGAAHVDSLKVENLPLELFEDEPVGATSSNDWESCNTPGYGDLAGLFSGSSLLQEDPCATNLSCMWAFIVGSTETYACGGHPEQIVIPYINARSEYIANEIWSPWIPVADAGKILNLQFSVYRHLPLNTQIHYVWHVRSLVDGCPTPWRDRNFVYFGEDREWFEHVEDLGAIHYVAGATHFQVALGVVDFCPFHCGPFGTGECHTHAPLFDNVKLYSVDIAGPHWSVHDMDMFQDTFSTDGTLTGTGRADSARDIKPGSSPSFTPGDSSIVLYVRDPVYALSIGGTNASGLSDDPNISTFIGRHKTKKQVYMYVAVWPLGQLGKSGAALAGTTKSVTNPSGLDNGTATRYFFAGTTVANGVTWTKIRMDYTYTGTATNIGDGDGPTTDPLVAYRFNVDLNDNAFEPGDTICYFYSATSPGGTTYFSTNLPGAATTGYNSVLSFATRSVTSSIDEAAANPMELTILPAGGYNRGGSILYVDGTDGLGNQPYFEGAFIALGMEDMIDRYDVRDPSSSASENRLDGRVVNVQAQLNDAYQHIIWDCGNLPVTLGDGDGNPLKTDDYGLLNTFLGNLTNPGGVYLSGDDIAEQLAGNSAPSAVTFKSLYMPFTLASGNHQGAGLGVSPKVYHWSERCFVDDFVVFGGCPGMNDFDVLTATSTSLVEMSYGASQSANAAVISNINGNARVFLSGFSFAYVRDDETDGIFDRAKYMRDLLAWMDADPPPLTEAGNALANSLAQNYPNPFNPQTAIAFSLKTRGHVELSIYDVSGRLVRTLANETRAPGAHQLTWDGRDGNSQPVASGVYFYRLTTPGFSQTKKMVLLK